MNPLDNPNSCPPGNAAKKFEAYGKRLIRYLAGGGIAAFSHTAQEEAADVKREKFLVAAVVVGVVWFVLWVA